MQRHSHAALLALLVAGAHLCVTAAAARPLRAAAAAAAPRRGLLGHSGHILSSADASRAVSGNSKAVADGFGGAMAAAGAGTATASASLDWSFDKDDFSYSSGSSGGGAGGATWGGALSDFGIASGGGAGGGVSEGLMKKWESGDRDVAYGYSLDP
ncbi:MAG: hypothetical protein J3K34DRAFT_519745 [Monoraphidium minutum]|nr:MAG: hypothetical protein J3K34DRAFT_519745 [Monoraphidium minutum]